VDLKQEAQELLALGALQSIIKGEYDRRRAALEARYVQLGVSAQMISTDDVYMGTVSLGKPEWVAEVINQEAMFEWFEQRLPAEIVTKTVSEIRPLTLRKLLDRIAAKHDPVDPDTGELLTWVKVYKKNGSMRVTSSADAKGVVRELFNQGEPMLQLEDGGDA